ncbi:N-acetyltransferase [Nocardia beijingensis]|uniref:GNAT family N-acetyltransferase n=1 Tax=Nocardia beijingensis TaxID=95162 RepID=UPI0033167D14
MGVRFFAASKKDDSEYLFDGQSVIVLTRQTGEISMDDISFRPAGSADLPFVGALCARSTSIHAEGIGYPRCDDEHELLAELALYGNKLDEHIFMVCDAAGAPIGFTGFLISDTDAVCYLIGPLLGGEWRTIEIAQQVLKLIVAHPLAPSSLSAYIEDDNIVLAEALQRTGWRRGAAQLEMSWNVSSNMPSPEAARGREYSRRLTSSDDPLFAATAELLGRQHNWYSDPMERLRDYLDDGYQVVVTEMSGMLVACALWIHVSQTDFGRLDYLSVSEEFQGRSFGSALTRHVLAEAAATRAIECVYLSVDPGNEAARRVYRACGFREVITSRKYSYERE